MDTELTHAMLLFAAALAGLVANWAKKRARGQARCTLMDYLGREPAYTMAAICAVLAAVVGMIAGGAAAEGWSTQSIAAAFMAGWVGDSALNKAPDDDAQPRLG